MSIRIQRAFSLQCENLSVIVALGLWSIWPRPLDWVVDFSGLGSLAVNPELPDIPSIVVLPFTNMSDQSDEYFSDGVTEEITNLLAHSGNFFVIARNSAYTYQGQGREREHHRPRAGRSL